MLNCEGHKLDIYRVNVFILAMTIFVSSAMSETVEFRIPEEQKVGYVVGNIREHFKNDQVSLDDLRFILFKQGNAYASLFEVDEISGNLTTTQVLDREALCSYTTNCQVTFDVAALEVIGTFFRRETVSVIVEDINDNAPMFPESSITIRVSETTRIGSKFDVASAIDRDTSKNFSVQSYELALETPLENIPFQLKLSFRINGTSLLSLVLVGILDREMKDSYKFYIVAKDGGRPPKVGRLLVSVSVVDVNDNVPRFEHSSYNITIGNNVTVGDVILTLKASDADPGRNGDVRFRLSSNQPETESVRYFGIDEILGQLKIKETLQYIMGYRFLLIVEASDMGIPPLITRTFVYVLVTDTINKAPKIQLYRLTNGTDSVVSEYAAVGSVVTGVVVSDNNVGRNGIVNCSILSDVFGLQRYSGNMYKVIVVGTLDRERTEVYNVSIRCEDNGEPRLSDMVSFLVHIKDENDNPPKFTQQTYFASIDGNNEIGDKITTVSAYDLDTGNNAMVTYSMATTSSRYALVDSRSGAVFANKVFGKDSADRHGISLTIFAEDGGTPSLTATTTVIVTVVNRNVGKPGSHEFIIG